MDVENRPRARRLAEVVREMKTADADRLDAVDRGGHAARARLELLNEELGEVFEEAGGEDAGFDFQITSGPAPRLWVDAATHVSVDAEDNQTYRVLRDGRGGRMLLGETDDVDEAADIVTRYVGTRILERERLMDDAAPAAVPPPLVTQGRGAAPVETRIVRKPSRFSRFVRAIVWFALGALAGLAIAWIAYGERLGLENPVPENYRQFYQPYVPPLPGEAAPVTVDPDAAATIGPDVPAAVPDASSEAGSPGRSDAPEASQTPADVEIVPVQPVPDAAADDAGDGAADDTGDAAD